MKVKLYFYFEGYYIDFFNLRLICIQKLCKKVQKYPTKTYNFYKKKKSFKKLTFFIENETKKKKKKRQKMKMKNEKTLIKVNYYFCFSTNL